MIGGMELGAYSGVSDVGLNPSSEITDIARQLFNGKARFVFDSDEVSKLIIIEALLSIVAQMVVDRKP